MIDSLTALPVVASLVAVIAGCVCVALLLLRESSRRADREAAAERALTERWLEELRRPRRRWEDL